MRKLIFRVEIHLPHVIQVLRNRAEAKIFFSGFKGQYTFCDAIALQRNFSNFSLEKRWSAVIKVNR